MRRLPAAALPLLIAAPAGAEPAFTVMSDGAVMAFGVSAVAMMALLAAATALALRGPRR